MPSDESGVDNCYICMAFWDGQNAGDIWQGKLGTGAINHKLQHIPSRLGQEETWCLPTIPGKVGWAAGVQRIFLY